MNALLQRLFNDDQADRKRWLVRGEIDGSEVGKCDRERRAHVISLLQAGEVRTGIDYYHAAFIFHHGETLDDYRRAHDLALQAVALGYDRARPLVAYACDRMLVAQGQSQKYGTQWTRDGGEWRLLPVDPETTDAERAEWRAPAVKEQEALMRREYGDEC